MDFSALVQEYGYAAVFLGAFLEGETVLILAGYAAHRGYLSLPTVMLVAFIGSLAGDLLCYFLGRFWGGQLLARAPHWHARADSFRELLHRHHIPLILSLRFLYGLRTVGAVVIGMCGIPPWRFLVLDLFSAAVWSISVGFGGYLIGSILERVLHDLAEYEGWIAGVIAVLGLLLWLVRRRLSETRVEEHSGESS
jgi:membrane protein DedA with SNARE-associated domain